MKFAKLSLAALVTALAAVCEAYPNYPFDIVRCTGTSLKTRVTPLPYEHKLSEHHEEATRVKMAPRQEAITHADAEVVTAKGRKYPELMSEPSCVAVSCIASRAASMSLRERSPSSLVRPTMLRLIPCTWFGSTDFKAFSKGYCAH